MSDKNDLIVEAILDLSKGLRSLGNNNDEHCELSGEAIEAHIMLRRDVGNQIAEFLDEIASEMQERTKLIGGG